MENQPGSDMFTFMGLHSGLLSLVGAPRCPTMASLRGKRLAMDASDSGFVFILEKALRDHGFNPDDYELVRGPWGPSQGSSVVRVRKIQDWELRLFACPPEKRTADCDTYEEQQNVFHDPVLFDGSDSSTAAVRKTRPSTVRRIDLKKEKGH